MEIWIWEWPLSENHPLWSVMGVDAVSYCRCTKSAVLQLAAVLVYSRISNDIYSVFYQLLLVVLPISSYPILYEYLFTVPFWSRDEMNASETCQRFELFCWNFEIVFRCYSGVTSYVLVWFDRSSFPIRRCGGHNGPYGRFAVDTSSHDGMSLPG